MAKQLLEAPITEADLSEYLSTRDDFALELRVFNAAMSRRLSGEHGGTYVDPITGKPRQFDARVTSTANGDQYLHLAIECKALQPHCPLLISRVPRAATESFHNLVRIGLGGSIFIPREQSLHHQGALVGKSMAQVGRTREGWSANDGDAYEKWNQAVSSIQAWVSDVIERPPQGGRHAFLPLLVVSDDTLWAVDYTADGAVDGPPRKLDETTYFVGREVPRGNGFTISHLHICTERGAREFLQGAATSGCLWWDEVFGK